MTSSATPAESVASTNGDVQPIGWSPYGRIPYVIPIITSTRPPAKVTLPAQSIGARRCTPISRRLTRDQIVPKMPNGTETRKTSRQSIAARKPPRTSPMNTPLIPTTLLMPSASPRWLAGNASVRIATELAISNAAPIPWTIRNTISQSAPAAPVIQSIVSSSEASV